MALETAFQFLHEQLLALKDAVEELQLNLSGDYHPDTGKRAEGHPDREQAPLLVQQLADKVSDLEGAVEEAGRAVASAERAVRHPRKLEEAQLALLVIQRCLNRLLKTLLMEVAAYDTLQGLVRMGRQKGGKWPQWISLLKTVIEGCNAPLYGSYHAVSLCWEEISEKLHATAISFHATNIGQQITTRENAETAANESKAGARLS